jgi:acyl carrier protein
MNAQEIQSWSKNYLAEILDTSADKIDPALDMDSLGLDSTVAVAYIMTLEDFVGVELMPELLFEHPTIKGLSEHIVDTLIPEAAGA